MSCPTNDAALSGKVIRPSWLRRRSGDIERMVIGDDAVHVVGRDGAVHSFAFADAIVISYMGLTAIGNFAHGCLVDIGAFGALDTLVSRLAPGRFRGMDRTSNSQM
jgi:hypothetical protein